VRYVLPRHSSISEEARSAASQNSENARDIREALEQLQRLLGADPAQGPYAVSSDITALEELVASLTTLVGTKTTVAESNSLPNSTDSTNTSSSISITYALHYKHVLVVSNAGAQSLVLPSDAAEPLIAIGDWGVVRWESGTNQPLFASDGTSVISGTYKKIARIESEVRWRKTAANTYQLGGNTAL
jgi:hypothetical protein